MATVYISSTYQDLKDHREAASRALRRLGHDVRAMEHYVAADDRPVDRCLADVADCTVYVGIIAWRYGYVPPDGNPEQRSITELEYRTAEALKKPRLIFLVREDAPWPTKFVDKGDPAKPLQALRDELGRDRLASFFGSEHELAELVGAAVTQWERKGRGEVQPPEAGLARFALRSPSRVGDLPDEPYPLLAPYTHQATFGGRDREIDDLACLVRQPPLVLCVHAASGAGKSSLLIAGLAPRLRDQGFRVSLLRDPGEPLLAQRLVASLFDVPQTFEMRDEDPGLFRQFADLMAQAKADAGKPPILILDQVDDFLRLADGRDEALARLGPLMAATAQRVRGEDEFSCRWVLCYRHEFHGIIDEWLGNVLREAKRGGRAGVETLPSNLSIPDRVRSWPLPLMGAPLPGDAPDETAKQAFLDAITKPLTVESSPGQLRYRLRFAGDGAERLAAAFARVREERSEEPLVPELQIVLRHLMNRAAPSPTGETIVSIPETPEELERRIDDALAEHLRKALAEAFPMSPRDEHAVRTARSEAVLVLSELTDVQGRRAGRLSEAELLRALPSLVKGDGDRTEVLEKLSSPRSRLILRDEHGRYTLSHDSMARVVRRFVEDERARGNLELDPKVLELRRLVAQRSDEYHRHENESALVIGEDQCARIEKSAPALLLDENRRTWWQHVQAHRTKRTRAARKRWAVAAAALLALLGVGGYLSEVIIGQARVVARETFARELTQVANQPDGARAFAQLADLVERHPEDWKWEDMPSVSWRAGASSVLAEAPWQSNGESVSDPARTLSVIERVFPAFIREPDGISAMSYSIEESLRREPRLEPHVARLRRTLREAYQRAHPEDAPPVMFRSDAWFLPDDEMLGFVLIKAGPFLMGSDRSKDPSAFNDEHWPDTPNGQQEYQLDDEFYIGRYEVTVAQYMACVEDNGCHPYNEDSLRGSPNHPVVSVSWDEALEYCGWLESKLRESEATPLALKERLARGSRVSLPSEPEWEKAARGTDGRIFPWGDKPDPTKANYGSSSLKPVGFMRCQDCAHGLQDMSGNAWEWTRSLYSDYPYEPSREDLSAVGARVVRGGAFYFNPRYVRAAYRGWLGPDGYLGFRVVVSRF